MLIDGEKWACEPCIRGHRVTSCKHHDRPLIRIKRKGRPFATCTICNATPCTAPLEHARAKRDAELKCPKKASTQRLHRHTPTGFLPIAPRPRPGPPSSDSVEGRCPPSVTKSKSRSGSKSACSISSASSPAKTSVYHDGAGDWSGSEAETSSGVESSRQHASFSGPVMSGLTPGAGQGSLSHSAPGSLYEYPVSSGETTATALFDPAYSLMPSTLVVSASQTQTMSLVSPLEGVNPFDFPLGDSTLGYLDEVDMNMELELPVMDEVFHVEDWSRYMWSAETGFEHLDTGFPPVSQ